MCDFFEEPNAGDELARLCEVLERHVPSVDAFVLPPLEARRYLTRTPNPSDVYTLMCGDDVLVSHVFLSEGLVWVFTQIPFFKLTSDLVAGLMGEHTKPCHARQWALGVREVPRTFDFLWILDVSSSIFPSLVESEQFVCLVPDQLKMLNLAFHEVAPESLSIG